MRKTAGRSLLWQTFFRYGGLLIAAAVVFGAVVGYQNVSVLVRESETLIASFLTTSAAWMDARVAEMDAIAYHIVDSSLLYPYEIFRNGYTAAQATNLLNSYKNANAYLSDIVLYYDESVAALFDAEPRYFTTTGPMDAETFWHYIHPVSSGRLSPGLVVTMPQQSMLIHPVTETVKNQERRFLLYLTPAGKMPMWENHRGLILFFIEESVVNEGLARTALLYDGVLGVYNTDGDAMYRYGEAPQTLDGHILDMVQDAGGQPVIAHTGSGVCVALRTQAHGLTYVLTLPAGFNAPAIYSAIASLLPFVALLTILALWGAYLLLRPLFRPMQQLKDMLRPYSLQSDESLSGIVYSIRELEAHRDRLESLGSQRATLARIQFLHNLLQGAFQSREEMESQMRLCECDCGAARYVVLCCRLVPAPETNERILDLCAAAMHVLTETDRLADEVRFAVPEGGPNEVSVLCGLPPETDASAHLESLYHTARAVFEGETGAKLVCACSEVGSGLMEVSALYLHARSALSGAFVRGNARLLRWEGTRRDANIGWYPVELEEALHRALTFAKADEACLLARRIEAEVRARELPEYAAKSVCLSLVRNLLRLEASLQTGVEDDQPYRTLIARIEAPGTTLDGFAGALCEMCEDFCARRARAAAPGDAQQREHCRQVKDFFQSHYPDSTLTLAGIAARFHLSEGHLSRIFKACTGTSVMQYLDTLRMENAKALLRRTDASLDEILKRCGYVDKSNFIRKFRRHNGVTPMNYREMMRIQKRSQTDA